MKKKYQIFISSTFSDLKKERQAAVEAVLGARHIPAGMELFSAGSESQLEVIKRWIEESDIYMLILGGRYGSIEAKTGLSYTELEYDHALDLKKPFFAVVLSDDWIDRKVRDNGVDFFEKDSMDKLNSFRKKVLSRICEIVNDEKDIKISVMKYILDIEDHYYLDGWVKGSDLARANSASNIAVSGGAPIL
jgi:hypothetical protein